MPTLRAPTASPAATSTTTRRPTTPASRSTIARTAAAHGAVVANYAGVTALRKDDAGGCAAPRVAGRRRRDRGPGATVVVNAAGVWSDDVRALDEGESSALDPAGQGHPHHRAVGEGAQRHRRVVPVPKDRRSVFVVPWGDLTYVGTTDTDYDGPLDDPAVHARRRRLPARALNAVDHRAGQRGRLARHVGGAAPARAHRRQRPHRRPLPPARVRRSEGGVVTVTGGKLTTYRRMAADTVDAVDAMLGTRRRLPHQAPAAARRRTAYEAPPDTQRAEPSRAPRRPLRHRSGAGRGARRRPTPRSASRSCPACRTSRPRPSTRCATRWPARSTTCSRGGPGRGCWPATTSAAAADDVAALLGAELGWDDAERARQVDGVPGGGRGRARRRRPARDRARGDLGRRDGHDRAADATDRVRWARDRRAPRTVFGARRSTVDGDGAPAAARRRAPT